MVPGQPPRDPDPDQPSLFDRTPPSGQGAPRVASPDPLRERIKELDPNSMTPLEALQELARLKGDLP
jgi:hypothetical protein